MMRLAKKMGPRDLQGCGLGFALAQFFIGHGLASPQDGLGHDNGAVDQNAEVDRTERQKIGGDMREVEEREHRHQRKGNADRDHEGAARAAEKQNQNEEHEGDAFQDGLAHLVNREHLSQSKSVAVDVGRRLLHAAQQYGQLGIELRHLGVHTAQGLRRILILEHQDDAFDRIRIFVLAQNAFALLMAEHQWCPPRSRTSTGAPLTCVTTMENRCRRGCESGPRRG